MNRRETVGITGFILGVILLLQNIGIIDLTNIIPDDNPTPVIPTPIPQPEPNPEPDNSNSILLSIKEEEFPILPESLAEVSEPIKTLLIKCKNPVSALVLARAYADWSDYLTLEASAVIDTTEKFKQVNLFSLKALLQKHRLSTICEGLSAAVDKVIIDQIGLDKKALTQSDREKISLAYQAISARCYEAFSESIKE